MPTLADITLPVSYEWCKERALVFSGSLAERLQQVHFQHGDPRHVPNPVALTDGRYMLNATILSECGPGGLMQAGFKHLDAARFSEIEVLPWAEAVALLPADAAS